MMIKKLKPMYDVKKLIRVGSFSDGGYVMPKKNLFLLKIEYPLFRGWI